MSTEGKVDGLLNEIADSKKTLHGSLLVDLIFSINWDRLLSNLNFFNLYILFILK